MFGQQVSRLFGGVAVKRPEDPPGVGVVKPLNGDTMHTLHVAHLLKATTLDDSDAGLVVLIQRARNGPVKDLLQQVQHGHSVKPDRVVSGDDLGFRSAVGNGGLLARRREQREKGMLARESQKYPAGRLAVFTITGEVGVGPNREV